MFVVTEAEAAAIRAVYDQRGEFSAAVELRQRFPGITDNAQGSGGDDRWPPRYFHPADPGYVWPSLSSARFSFGARRSRDFAPGCCWYGY